MTFSTPEWKNWDALDDADMVVIPMKDWPDWSDAEPVYGIRLVNQAPVLEPWHEQKLEIDAMRTTGDLVVVSLRWVATGRESEIEVEMPLAGVYTITDGRLSSLSSSATPTKPAKPPGCGSSSFPGLRAD